MQSLCFLLFLCCLKVKLVLTRQNASQSVCNAGAIGDSDSGLCGTWLQHSGTLAAGSAEQQRIFASYVSTCREYGIRPSADVLNRLQLGAGRLALEPREHHDDRCGDLDVRALVLLLVDGDGALLSNLRILDLSKCTLGTSSALLIASLIQHPKACLSTLDLSYQSVSAEGACAIASALSSSKLKVLRMKQSWLYDEGGQVMLKLLKNASAHDLEELDLENNYIPYSTCRDLKAAAQASGVKILLSGNRVFDEVLNAVTHGVGEMLVIFGCVVMGITVSEKPVYIKVPVVIYLISLNVLYIASTLFHSFFALGYETVRVFHILDYSGIFILIAGTYTPFLAILFHGQRWASILLGSMWTAAILGICTAAFYHGPHAIALRLTFFLGMGWTVVACIGPIIRELGSRGTAYLIAGGVLYTLGVPFFVKHAHTFGMPNHAIWHIFVMAASISHYLCVLWYVVAKDAADVDTALLEGQADSDSSDEFAAAGKIHRVKLFC